MKTAHRRFREAQVIGERYQIDGFLGAGDSGEVYQCRDLGDGKARLAIKVVWDTHPVPGLMDSLSRELSFLRRLSHPNLARLHDFGVLEDTGRLFLVQEFIEGKDLYSGSERMNTEEVLSLIVELCKTIQHLHSQGIVHGNLKPSNAVLSGNGKEKERLKVLDFGLTRWLHHGQPGSVCAMPAYTAPEVLLGGCANTGSDLYSLGILTYQLLTRRLPFGDEDPGFLVQKHLQGSVDLRPIERLSGGAVLSQLLRGLLDKDPSKRLPSAKEAIRLLGEVFDRDCSGTDIKQLESHFPAARFVGREEEMLCLQECASRVRASGRGWTVFVTGEAGSGKTRCMEELRSWALLEGWRVIEGTCGTREEGSYAPFRQILARTEPASGEALFHFGDASGVSDSGTFGASSEFAAGQFRDLLTRELVRRLTERPTLLLLHDFHRADEATGAVLDYLSSDIQAHTILMCVSLRSVEDPRGMLGRLMELAVRQQRGEVLALEPLSKENVGELIAGMTGDGRLKVTLGAWIYRNIGGNPFFLEEMLKHLVEQGLLRRRSGAWVFIEEDLRNLEIPASVGAVLQRRLEQLSPAAVGLSRWLALIHRAVSRDFLNSVMSIGAAETNEALQELINRQMVRMELKDAEETVEFRHALIAEVILADLPKKLRRKMHRKIAEVLEQTYGAETHLQELAMHYMEGKMGGIAVKYALASASQARAEFAHENALRYFEYVLKARIGLTREKCCTAAIEASDTMFAMGLPKRAINLLKMELRENRTIGIDLRAHMFMQLALAYQHFGDSHVQEFYCRKGLRMFRNRPGNETNIIKAMLWAELAFGAVLQSHPKRGLLFLDKAIKSCPDSASTALGGRIQSLAASLHRVACNLHEALIASEKAANILNDLGESYLTCSAYSTLGTILMGLGRFSAALERHEKAVSLSHKSRSVILISQALGNLAECLCRMGRTHEAINVAEQAVKSVSECNNPAISHAFNTILAEIKLSAGDYQGACRIINKLDGESGQNLALYTLGHANYVSANMNFILGNFNSALKHVEKLCCMERREAPFYEHELAAALEARIYFEQGQIQKATMLLRRLDKKAAQKHWPYQMCMIKLHLGEILIKQQKLEDAEKYAKSALKLANGMQSNILISHGHLLLGLIYSFMHHSEKSSGLRCYNSSLVNQKLDLDEAIGELQSSCRMSESSGSSEISWRAHAALCQIYRSLDNPKCCFDHAKRAYEQLYKLESQVSSDILPLYCAAFGRSQIKSELIRLIEAYREQEHTDGIEVAEIQDDEKARILLHVSATVNSIRDLNTLLEAILDQLIPAVSVERALVFLRDEATGKLRSAKGRNNQQESLTGGEAVIHGILEEVYTRGRPFVTADAQKDARVLTKESAVTVQTGKLLCAPLKVSGRVVGVLYADHSSPARSLSESTISLFEAFCNLAAIAIDNALAHQQLIREKTELEQYLHQAREPYTEIVGKSPIMETLRDRIGLAAGSPLDILITGESGTGKELVAQAIYRTGRRKSGKFVAVDCGSLSDTLAEAELFGYRRGAFTGALENRQGLLEAANGGIIFLDEIANLPFRLQAKFLRVLQEREVRRLGETAPRKIDVQVIAATNKNLLEEVRIGRFRDDLYYRLKTMEIRVPPLRERPEDIPLLIAWFMEKTAELGGGRHKKFSQEALEMLMKYSYPGNVRELINIISSSYFSTNNSMLGLDQLPPEVCREEKGETSSDLMLAGKLYQEILEGSGNFIDLLKKPFLRHQFGSPVVEGVVRKALQDANGRYRDAFVRLRIPDRLYSATMQFLRRNKCYMDFRPFRRQNPI